jgi:hypothetical protein
VAPAREPLLCRASGLSLRTITQRASRRLRMIPTDSRETLPARRTKGGPSRGPHAHFLRLRESAFAAMLAGSLVRAEELG